MGIALTQTGGPAVEPLSLTEAKLHLRVEHTADDLLIADLITAAREYVEATTRRQCITATWVLKRDHFPGEFVVPYPPLQSVTSIIYVNTSGATASLSSAVYTVDTASIPGKVYETYGQSWPATRGTQQDVRMTYKAGYGDAATTVPEAIRAAMKLLIGDWYWQREEQGGSRVSARVAAGVGALLMPYRVWEELE